jgi:hypothetical protein
VASGFPGGVLADESWNPVVSGKPMEVVVSEVRTQPRKPPVELRYTLRFERIGNRMRIGDRGLASVRFPDRELEPSAAWVVAKLMLPVVEIEEDAGITTFPDHDRDWRAHYLALMSHSQASAGTKAVMRAAADGVRAAAAAPAHALWTSLALMRLDARRREAGVDWAAMVPLLEDAHGDHVSVRELADESPGNALQHVEFTLGISADEVRDGMSSLLEDISKAVEENSDETLDFEPGGGRVRIVLGVDPKSGQLRELRIDAGLRATGAGDSIDAVMTSEMRLDWLGVVPAAQSRDGFRLGACDARSMVFPAVWQGPPPYDADEALEDLKCGEGVETDYGDGLSLWLGRIPGTAHGLEARLRFGDEVWRGTNEDDPESIALSDRRGRVVAQVAVTPPTVPAVYSEIVNQPANLVARELATIGDVQIAGEDVLCDERVTLRFDAIPYTSLASLLADVCGVTFVSVETDDGVLGAFRARETPRTARP